MKYYQEGALKEEDGNLGQPSFRTLLRQLCVSVYIKQVTLIIKFDYTVFSNGKRS
jgi:hypothetical protein